MEYCFSECKTWRQCDFHPQGTFPRFQMMTTVTATPSSAASPCFKLMILVDEGGSGAHDVFFLLPRLFYVRYFTFIDLICMEMWDGERVLRLRGAIKFCIFLGLAV